MVFTSVYILKGGINLFLTFHFDIFYQAFAEELEFRAFLLGLIVNRIPLRKHKRLPFYLPQSMKTLAHLIGITVLIGIIFSDLHLDWVTDPSKLVIRTLQGFVYGFAFLLTNKKIYAPGTIHYINNIYAIF